MQYDKNRWAPERTKVTGGAQGWALHHVLSTRVADGTFTALFHQHNKHKWTLLHVYYWDVYMTVS